MSETPQVPLVEITSDPATGQHSVYLTRIWKREDGTMRTDKQFMRTYLTLQAARDGSGFLWSAICDAHVAGMAQMSELMASQAGESIGS